jgi:uncharacterized protein involved in type VI secretion and phage assembly
VTPELKVLIGQPVGVGVKTQGGERRWVSGLIESVQTEEAAGGFTPVRLRVRSALSLLDQRRSCSLSQMPLNDMYRGRSRRRCR